MAYPRGHYDDPMLVLERKQEREARSKRGKAKAGLEALFEGEAMTQDQSAQIDALLVDWYHWAKADRAFLGHSRVSAMFRGAEPMLGDTYSDGDDADARIRAFQCEAVDACLNQLPMQMRAAVGVHTRNKAAGVSVHRNPRHSIEEQHTIYQQAKQSLCPMLIREGLVNR